METLEELQEGSFLWEPKVLASNSKAIISNPDQSIFLIEKFVI